MLKHKLKKQIKFLMFNAYSIITYWCVLFNIPIILLLRKIKEKKIKKTISLWAGTPIITLNTKAKAERLLGVKTFSLVYDTYYITHEFDINLSKIWRSKLLARLFSGLVFLVACILCDRLHFYCDRGLLEPIKPFIFNPLELWIYKLLNIDLFFWTYGADVRTRDITVNLGTPNCCTYCHLHKQACICDPELQRKSYLRLKRYAKAIFSMGDMQEYTPGSINDLFYWPIDLKAEGGNRYKPYYPNPSPYKPLKVVHAPNHRMFKGTRFLIEAINELKKEGVNIDLILVEKIPNKEAIEIYKKADIIFDQCLIGFHGYFAIEAMALGKPVMCFIRKPEKYLLYPEECPIINVHINNLKDKLRYFEKNRYLLKELGKKSRKYIEKYFTIEAFAERLKKAYLSLGVLT